MRIATKWGLRLAAALIAWTLLIHAAGIYTTRLQYASLVDTLAIVLPISFLAAAILERRRAQDGRLSLRDGFSTGMVAMMVSWPLTTLFMLAYHKLINPRWLELLISFETSRMQAAGATAADIDAAVSQLARRADAGAEVVTSLIGTLVLGAIVSAALAALFRRSRSSSSGS